MSYNVRMLNVLLVIILAPFAIGLILTVVIGTIGMLRGW